MQNFFEKNKIFIGIIMAGLIIGIFIYISSVKQGGLLNSQSGQTLTKNNLGKNSSPSLLKECVDYTKASDYINKEACIKGVVDNIYISSKGTNFLNFCPDYKSCSFRGVIFVSNAGEFSDIKGYEGKTVEITGFVKDYQGLSEIVITKPNQIVIK